MIIFVDHLDLVLITHFAAVLHNSIDHDRHRARRKRRNQGASPLGVFHVARRSAL